MRIRLTRKLADRLDGIDVKDHHVGDVFDLPGTQARVLVAEKWAIPERRTENGSPPATERRAVHSRSRGDERIL